MDILTGLTENFIIYPLVFILGLSIGSFLNVVIYRLPRADISIFKPARSFCPACGYHFSWVDNIPLLSWILLRARCRSCHRPIAIRYPLVELAAGLLALYLYHRLGFTFSFAVYLYFTMCLLSIALIDLELMVIPVVLMYPTTILGLVLAAVEPSNALTGHSLWLKIEPTLGPNLSSLVGSGLGLLVGWGSLKLISTAYKLTRGHEGMGDGDPPLLGMIGAFLGYKSIPMIILGSSVVGLISVGILMVLNRKHAPKEGWALKALPFGPFLVLAALAYLFFGPALIDWYLSLIRIDI